MDKAAGSASAAELRTQQSYLRVREAILRAELPAGEPISQVQLAASLGVSRTPLREALRMLEREGLIASAPNRRVTIPPLSLADLEHTYATRIVLEALAARLSVPAMTVEDIMRLRDLLDEMAEGAKDRDLDRWAVPHREFHDCLRAYSGPRIQRLARDAADHSERYHRVHMEEPRAWSSGARDHEAITALCEARDARGAARELATHLARTPLSIVAAAHPHHDPVIVREALRLIVEED